MELVIDEFLDNYATKKRHHRKGVIKVLAAPPGVGKSHRLVRVAEREALTKRQQYELSIDQLNSAIISTEVELQETTDLQDMVSLKTRIERLKNRRDNLSQAHVLVAGPFINGWEDILQQGADTNLWYNLKSRNAENCKHLDQVNSVADKGYTAMTYCQAVCPFRTWCEKEGYLAQEKERKSKPITYVRHQNLNTSLVDEYKIIIIDENPLPVFDAPIIVQAKEMYPLLTDWENFADPNQVVVLTKLLTAIRRIMNENVGLTSSISGLDFFNLLDEQLNRELGSLLSNLTPEILETYQPDNILGARDLNQLPIRCVPILFNLLIEEYPKYTIKQQYNSKIHLVSGKLEIYPLKPLKISQNKPIIVADGTALPKLYGMLSDRVVETYSPEVFNPLAQTTVWYGSDFTRSSINRQVGEGIYDYLNWLNQHKMSIDDILGESFDLSNLPVDEDMYGSSVLKRALALLKGVAQAHNKILFVTYKNVRVLVEKRVQELYPDLAKKISFAHYGSLRGTNRYLDHDAVLLVGCYRQPYEDAYRRIQAWASLDPSIPYIPHQIQFEISPYHSRYEAHSYPTFSDEFAKSFVDMLEVGEIRQCIDRIRLFSSDIPKYAYLALSRPSAKWVTNLAPVGKVANGFIYEKQRQVYNFLNNFYLTYKKFPTYDYVIQTFHVSRRVIKELRDQVLKEGS